MSDHVETMDRNIVRTNSAGTAPRLAGRWCVDLLSFVLLFVGFLTFSPNASAQTTYSFLPNQNTNGYCGSLGEITPTTSPMIYAIAVLSGGVGRCETDADGDMSYRADKSQAVAELRFQMFSDSADISGFTLANDTGGTLAITVKAFDETDTEVTSQPFNVPAGDQPISFPVMGVRRVSILIDTPQTNVGLIDYTAMALPVELQSFTIE